MRRFSSGLYASAGLIAVVVGYTSSAAIIFQAASAVGANAGANRFGYGHWASGWGDQCWPGLVA